MRLDWTKRTGRRTAMLVGVAALAVAGCSADPSADGPDSTVAAAQLASDEDLIGDEAATPNDAAFSTPCFDLDADFELPDGYEVTNASSGSNSCRFVVQDPDQADATVIAGELYQSSSGRSFEEFVAHATDGLAVGQEAEVAALGSLNTAPSGRSLAVDEEQELVSPNRAVVLTHESDRADEGSAALTAIVDVPTDGGPTEALLVWGRSNPVNDQLIKDLIQAMTLRPMDVS